MRILSLAMGLVLTLSVQAQAAPITVVAGDVYTFNFDLTSQTPAPPYNGGIAFSTGLVTSTLFDAEDTEVGGWEMWSELNAAGVLGWSYVNADLGSVSGFLPGAEDGVFSFRFTLTQGSVIINPTVVGYTSEGLQTASIAPSSVTHVTTVPEPGSMLLLGAGLLSAGVGRWRLRRA